MILQNSSKGTVLSSDLKLVTNLLDKLFGLILRKNPRSLLFHTRFGIHTFFVKEEIDVLVVDSQDIVRKAKTISPNRIFFYNFKFNKVIELPKGTNLKSKTQKGDRLRFLNHEIG